MIDNYMEIESLIKSIMGLIVILAFLLGLMFYSNKSKKVKKIKKVVKSDIKIEDTHSIDSQYIDLETLVAIIRNKKTDSKKLKDTLDLVLKYHGTIHEKLGIRSHPDFKIYMKILFIICRHPHTNKDIIINFEKELIRLNPKYKVEINDAITKGLNSRVV